MRDLNAAIRSNTLDKRSRSSGSPSRDAFLQRCILGSDTRSGKVCCPPSNEELLSGVLAKRRLQQSSALDQIEL